MSDDYSSDTTTSKPGEPGPDEGRGNVTSQKQIDAGTVALSPDAAFRMSARRQMGDSCGP
jgi:hypothetical protein